MEINKGKLIVIDGIDGSDKATQTKLLAVRLKEEGYNVKTIDFPQYENNFFGKLIGECLTGQYGDFVALDPHIGSALYAADRFESSQTIRKWLDEGFVVVTDRYVSSNQIHQGGKIKDIEKRKEFLAWLDVMEYETFKIPRPDIVVYLDVPFEVSSVWLKNKNARADKKYLEDKKDLHEENLSFLKDSRDSALFLTQENKNWRHVECCEGSVCMSPEAVLEAVFTIVSTELKK